MKNRILAAVVIVSVGIVAGCGSNGASTQAITGKVADGYLVNATVFMDKNGNYQLDAGEPTAMSGVNGAYSLTVDAADVGKYPIVALATQGVTVDEDNPGVPLANSYLLSMPKDSISGAVNSNFISPLSSQLREMMETGQYANIAEAMTDLRSQLGLPAGANVLADYMATQHVGMHTAAQRIAGVMGGQMSQVIDAGSGATTGVQVNRYRGMMGAIFSNLSSIKSTNPQIDNAAMVSAMTTMLASMPRATAGQPYQNMSSAFRAGMTRRNGGMGGQGGGMMGR